MKSRLMNLPLVARSRKMYWDFLARRRPVQPFPGSKQYWEERYQAGGNSGAGSYALLADFKADVLNRFVITHGVQTVIEFGCGDGNQLALARYPHYTGFDVSATAVALCSERFQRDPTRSFRLVSAYAGETADLTLSLDVIYHLIEDHVFEQYMRMLFGASRRHVIVYSSDSDDNAGYVGTHVKHRRFTRWVERHLGGWTLVEHVPNRYPYRDADQTGSFADFFVYRKVDDKGEQGRAPEEPHAAG